MIVLALAFLCFSFLGCESSDPVTSTKTPDDRLVWHDLKSGLSWAEAHPIFQKTEKNLILVKIDPLKFEFSLYENKSMAKAKTLREISRETSASLVVNGAFFDENFQPLTYLKSNGKVLHKLSNASLVDGVFGFTADGHAQFFELKDFQDTAADQLVFAVQNGPMLINDRQQVVVNPELKKTAARTAIGLDAEENVIILLMRVSVLDSQNIMPLADFANMLLQDMSMRTLGLHSVINLDGGPSSGLMLEGKYYPEMNKVQNAIVVKPRFL